MRVYPFLLLVAVFCCETRKAGAQVFHFDDTLCVIMKTTAQSPAHGYLEIFNDINLDTSLRWRASFSSIPSAWTVTFDDQNAFHTPLLEGDSADFVLYDSMVIPQKLIIGALTNNTAGAGSVDFDVFDPADPSSLRTVQFRFIITEAPSDVEVSQQQQPAFDSENLYLKNLPVPGRLQLYSVSGKKILEQKIDNSLFSFRELAAGGYIVVVTDEHDKRFSFSFCTSGNQ